MKRVFLAAIVLTGAIATHASAQASGQAATQSQGPQPPAALQGWGLGAAIVGNFNVGSNRADSADVVNGVVRVSKDENASLGIMFEGHYFFSPKTSFLGIVDSDKWGWGPFVAVATASNGDTLASGALGLMAGFPTNALNSHPFTIGLGFSIAPNTQVLGDGIFANKPLPAGETTVRFKNTTTYGVLVAVGAAF